MESDIPFPLLAGQWIATFIDNKERYVKIGSQPRFFDLTFAYEIGPGLELQNQNISTGTGSGANSVFRTKYLKEWVTWIDNKHLQVSWKIDDLSINSLNSFPYPQDSILTPYGSVNFPLFIYNNQSGNVTFTLTNTSLTKTIRGTLHILMYDYTTEPMMPAGSPKPAQYTPIYYKRGDLA
jgi:hypothetical protein